MRRNALRLLRPTVLAGQERYAGTSGDFPAMKKPVSSADRLFVRITLS
jgi:hypothetical protein